MKRPLRVALAQQPAGRDPLGIVRRASSAGADIIVFPEMYSNGYARFDPDNEIEEAQWCAGAIGLDSEYIGLFREAARRHRVFVVATLLEAGDPSPFNSALLIDPDGETALHHRKVHICDFDSPEIACGRGDAFNIQAIETRAGPVTLGLMICMDREFPEAAASLSAKGAEVALVPNCCDLATDASVGDVRMAQIRGRAFETAMGIAVTNYPAPKCDGHSLAVDPQGRLIALAAREPAMVLAEFDLSEFRRIREDERFRWCGRT